MDDRVIYKCACCSAATPATVTGLADPSEHVSESHRASLRTLANAKRAAGQPTDDDPVGKLTAELLAASAQRELTYATCPHCGKRNPAGVAERASSRTQTRVVGTLVCVLLAVGTWLLPWVGYAVVAVSTCLSLVLLIVLFRASPKRWAVIALNVGYVLVALAATWFDSRSPLLLTVILGVRFSIYRDGDDRWKAAQETIRFETLYR